MCPPPIYRTARSILKELWDLPMKIFFIASNNGDHRATRDQDFFVCFFLKISLQTSETAKNWWSAEYSTNIYPYIVYPCKVGR